MRNILSIIILLLIFISISIAQVQDEPLFGTFYNPIAYDTIDTNTDTLYSRPIIFADLNNVEGALSISGFIQTLTGTDTTFSCQLRMITDVSGAQYSYDIWRDLGIIKVSDSTN